MSTSEKNFQDLNPLYFTLDKILSYLASNRKTRVAAVLPLDKDVDELMDGIWDSEGYVRYIRHINNTSNVIYGKNSAIYLYSMSDYERMRGLKFDVALVFGGI